MEVVLNHPNRGDGSQSVLEPQGGAPPRLEALYRHHRATPSDINEHLPTLFRYASGCRHVTEFGVRTGRSTTAFLRARPEELCCYDLNRHPEVNELERLAAEVGVKFHFRQASSRGVMIKPTDLLFVDTLHTADQVRCELLNAAAVRKYLIFHDTELFGERDEQGDGPGIWVAVAAFLRLNDCWRLAAHYPNNNGLTILIRVRD